MKIELDILFIFVYTC